MTAYGQTNGLAIRLYVRLADSNARALVHSTIREDESGDRSLTHSASTTDVLQCSLDVVGNPVLFSIPFRRGGLRRGRPETSLRRRLHRVDVIWFGPDSASDTDDRTTL